MQLINYFNDKPCFCKIQKPRVFVFLFISFLLEATHLCATESSHQFIQGTDNPVVYKDVPGLSPSDKYNIRVRSAATNNNWVDVFANYNYNRAFELPDILQYDGTEGPNPAVNELYVNSKTNSIQKKINSLI